MISETVWIIRSLRKVLGRMFLVSCFILFAFGVQAQSLEKKKIECAISDRLSRYPESTLCDLYKSFFQDVYGPGHLIPDSASAAERLQAELPRSRESLCDLYEITGFTGDFYRVSLSVIDRGIVPFEVFLTAFLESAAMASAPEIVHWAKSWARIEQVARVYQDRIQCYDECKAQIEEMLEEKQYVMGHSALYNKAYHPHYRLIHRSIFTQRLLPLINAASE